MRKEVRIGLFFLAVFVIFSFFALKTNSLTKFWKSKSSYSVKSYFDNVSGIFTGSPVTLSGIKIGVVSKVRLKNNKALLTLLIENDYKVADNAQCTIVTAGIVGEKFVEIRIPKGEKSQGYLKDGDEIKSFKAFDMDALTEKLNRLSNEFEKVAKSISDNFGDKENKESIKGLLKNLNLVGEKLNTMTEDNGDLRNLIKNFNNLSKRLIVNSKSLEKIISKLDKNLLSGDDSLLKDLKNYLKNLDKLTSEIREITNSINKGEGSAGKLIKDSELYDEAKKSIENIEKISTGIREKQASLSTLSGHYNAELKFSPKEGEFGFSVLGGLDFSDYSLFGRAKERIGKSGIKWSGVVGRNIGLFTLYGGVVDSRLGVIALAKIIDKKVNMFVEVSDFAKDEGNPNLSTSFSLQLIKGFNFIAGLEDFLREENRRFYIGVSLAK